MFEGIALDISGNGMHLRSKLDANVGAKVLLTPRFKDLKREFFLIGVIRRKEKSRAITGMATVSSSSRSKKCANSSARFPPTYLPKQYLTFNENQRSLLLNHIFAKQLALKKKGLI